MEYRRLLIGKRRRRWRREPHYVPARSAHRGGTPRKRARSELASGAANGGGGRSAPDPDAFEADRFMFCGGTSTTRTATMAGLTQPKIPRTLFAASSAQRRLGLGC